MKLELTSRTNQCICPLEAEFSAQILSRVIGLCYEKLKKHRIKMRILYGNLMDSMVLGVT